jgi:hypothetical protein
LRLLCPRISDIWLKHPETSSSTKHIDDGGSFPQFQWLLMAAEFRQFGGILWFLATAFEARKQDPKHVTVLLKEIEICRFSVDQQTEKITD